MRGCVFCSCVRFLKTRVLRGLSPTRSNTPPVSTEELSEPAKAPCKHQGLAMHCVTKPGPGKVFVTAQPFSYLILTPLCVHLGQGYHSRVYLRMLLSPGGSMNQPDLAAHQDLQWCLASWKPCSGQNCLSEQGSSRGGRVGLETSGSMF